MDNGYQQQHNNHDGLSNSNNVQISSSTQQLLNLGMDGGDVTAGFSVNSSGTQPINISQGGSINTTYGFNPIIDDSNLKKRKIKTEDGVFDNNQQQQQQQMTYSHSPTVNNQQQQHMSQSGNFLNMSDNFQQLQQHQQQLANLTNQYQNMNQQQQQQPQQLNSFNQATTTTTTTNNNNSSLSSTSFYPIPSISITSTTNDNNINRQHLQPGLNSSGNFSPRHSPNGSPHHTPIGSPRHSPLLPSETFLSLDNDSSDPLSPNGYNDTPPFTWSNYKSETWYSTLNAKGEDMPTPLLNIIASKGFSFINNSWVYCRRNHFQLDITAVYPRIQNDFMSNLSSSNSNIDPSQTPSYLLIDGNKMPINGLTLTIKGIKNRTDMTQPENEVELFQTNSKREKQGEHAPKPVAIQFGTLVSVQRLHFRKATLNNARRNGLPNPHQEFNQLVVSLYGRCMAQEYCIVSFVSPPLIVRTAISSPSVSPAATDLSPVHTPDTHQSSTLVTTNPNSLTTPTSPFNTFGSNLNTFPDFSSMRLQSPGHSPISPRVVNNNNSNNNNNQQQQQHQQQQINQQQQQHQQQNINQNIQQQPQQQHVQSISSTLTSLGIPTNLNTNKLGHGCEWMKGDQDKTIVYNGKVGINVEAPAFALSVQGTIYASEGVYHPSDMRLKYDLKTVDSQLNLRNVNKLKIYDYKLNPQWAYMNGRDPYQEIIDRGVMAQELQKVLPNSVKTIGNRVLGDKEIENLLVINSESLIFENIGATQQLSKQFDELQTKITAQEKQIQKLKSRSNYSLILLSVLFILFITFIFFFTYNLPNFNNNHNNGGHHYNYNHNNNNINSHPQRQHHGHNHK